jgi:hypothetical protein
MISKKYFLVIGETFSPNSFRRSRHYHRRASVFFGAIRGYIRAAFQIKTPPQETGAEKVLALFLGLFSPQPKERQKVEARTAMWNFGPTLKGAKPYTAASIHHPLIPVVLIIRFRIGGIHG